MLAGDRDARHRRPIERCALAGDNRRSSSEPPADADVCDEPPESRGCWCDKRLSASGRRAALPWVERDVRRRTRRHRLPSGTCRLPDHADKHRQPPDAARGPRRSMQRGGDAIASEPTFLFDGQTRAHVVPRLINLWAHSVGECPRDILSPVAARRGGAREEGTPRGGPCVCDVGRE